MKSHEHGRVSLSGYQWEHQTAAAAASTDEISTESASPAFNPINLMDY